MPKQGDECNDHGGESRAKKPRLMAEKRLGEVAAAQQVEGSDDIATLQQCSLQNFLSVPLHIIFRQQPGSRPKPLLTRAEAQLLLRVCDLSAEIDSLVKLSAQALERQMTSRALEDEIAGIPTFRSVIPILALHERQIPEQALRHLELEVDRVLATLGTCADSLKEHSEQSWSMSESLLDALGDVPVSGQTLASEKRRLGDLQDELASRVDHVLRSCAHDGTSASRIFAPYEEHDLFMGEFCCRLFGVGNDGAKQQKKGAARSSSTCRAPDNNSVHTRPLSLTRVAAYDGREEKPAETRNVHPLHEGRENNDDYMIQVYDASSSKVAQSESVVNDEATKENNSQTSINSSTRKKETAKILTSLQLEGDTSLRDSMETEPLPEIANTQSVVSALAGLSYCSYDNS
jgi:hypothetical protein